MKARVKATGEIVDIAEYSTIYAENHINCLMRLGRQVGNLFRLQRHQKDIGTFLKYPISIAIDSAVVYKVR